MKNIKGWFAGCWVTFLKVGKFIPALKALKAVKLIKVFLSLGSMIVSIFVYSFSLGWKFAVGFIALLFIHEMGHVIACKQKGIHASAPVFIPFLGAAIFIPKMEKREDEAYVGISGPVLGSIGALVCLALYFVLPYQSALFLMLSYTGVILNLFNLIPIRPLDGGRITQVVSEGFKYAGLALAMWLTYLAADPGLILIWLIIIGEFGFKDLHFKFAMMLLLLVSMTVLFMMYPEKNSPIQQSLDILLGAFLTFMCWVGGKTKNWQRGEKDADSTREMAPITIRFKWLGYYSVLTLVLVAVLYWQATLIPPHTKGQ